MNKRFLPGTDLYIAHRQDPVKGYMFPGVQNKKPHFHNQCEMIMVTGGEAVFHVTDREYLIKSGMMLLISNMENHHIVSYSAGYDRYAVRFSSEALAILIHDPFLLSIFKQRPEGFCHSYSCSPEETQCYTQMLCSMLHEYQEQKPYWGHQIASGLQSILIRMYRNQPQAFPASRAQAGQAVIFDIQTYIESHLSESLTLESVAGKFFINKFHLSHLFPSVTGYTFKRYVITARLSKAKDLLLHTDKEIQDVARESGFASASHFIRVFKTHEDVSPLQYRNRAKVKV